MHSVLYAPTVVSLIYTMVVSQRDIAHTMGILSRFMDNPGCAHWKAVKHIFRYLVGTQDYDIAFAPDEPSGLVGYTDSDYGGCIDNRKSTSGYCFKFGHGSTSWRLKLEDCAATSTMEADYIASSDAAKEALWLGRLAVTFRNLTRVGLW